MTAEHDGCNIDIHGPVKVSTGYSRYGRVGAVA